MTPSSPQFDAAGRVAALRRLELMDTPPEPEYDELVELAAAICEVPISLLSFLDDKRQWHKANVGLPETERPLELTFCQYTIRQDDLLLVEDTRQDEFFHTHPSVVGEPSVRFYAGISIKTPDGYPVGTLCVADLVPRHLTSTQIATLKVLGRQANARIELREQRRALERALAEAEQAKLRLAGSEARFKTFMDSAPFFGYLKDRDGRYLYYNRLMAERFDVTTEQWLGKSDFDLFPAELADTYRGNDLDVLEGGKLRIVDETTVHADGSTSHWRSYKFPCPDGTATLLGGISIDVTEDVRLNAELLRSRQALETANIQLHELATTDVLTGLPNRRAVDDRLTVEFLAARRSHRPLSVMLLDVDDFKQHNDRFGHDAGDDILRHLAKLLRHAARSHDLVARYGGEEFIVVLPDTDETQASQLGDRILSLLHNTPWLAEPVTVSAGIACITPATPSQNHLVSLADEALYVAKRCGKNRVITCSAHLNQAAGSGPVAPDVSAAPDVSVATDVSVANGVLVAGR